MVNLAKAMETESTTEKKLTELIKLSEETPDEPKPPEPPKEPEPPEPPKEPPPASKPSKAEDLISKANAAAARQEAANAKHEELLKQQEAMNVEKTLGGETEAGTGAKEETPAEYKDRVLKGEV